MGEKNTFRLLVMKLEGKRCLGRLMHVWDDNIKMYFKELVWDDMDWMGVIWTGVIWFRMGKSSGSL